MSTPQQLLLLMKLNGKCIMNTKQSILKALVYFKAPMYNIDRLLTFKM